jgi:hypothetical protein
MAIGWRAVLGLPSDGFQLIIFVIQATQTSAGTPRPISQGYYYLLLI